jgi:hypothetical protein
MAASQGSAINAAKRVKLRPLAANASRFGEVGDRQQQRSGVRQVGAGVHVRFGPGVEPGGGGEHHRGQQHHRGVQAERRGDQRGDREYLDQKPARAPCRGVGHPRSAGVEQALVIAQLGEDEHGREEADHRSQPPRLGHRVVHRDRPDSDDHTCGRDGYDGLRPAPRAHHRARQHGQEQDGGECFWERGVQSRGLSVVESGRNGRPRQG